MSPERWQQIKTTFFAAMDREDPRERAAYLDAACGEDVDLRQRVQSLLDQPPDDFDSLAEEISLTSPDRNVGRRFGAYELVREIGRGGMGSVWLARRADEQFQKLVAIKLLKRGTDTDEVLRRFHAERQILARLDHPNIARLLDAGTTDDDLPYFVMEYVEGRRVTEFVQEENLSLADRLRLFLKICAAVQFAHQNLVVHRDLKPGNILVTPDREPKLLDFGVAKLLSSDDEAWQVTVAGEQRFTPAYASPEQVRGEAVTTVSDVYSAGTILYELLTGKPAHRFSTVQPAPTELLRVVVQEEPLRPSLASQDHRLRGDLDTIVLKALRKEPERRYSGMGAFAADIERYLENRPVIARKDTFAYRSAKFIQRNKLGVAAATLVLLTLIGGIIATAWEARVANHRFNDVRRLAHSVLFDYHDAIARLPGSTKVREQLVKDSLDYLDSLGREATNDSSLQRELAAAYLKVADVEGQSGQPNLGRADGAMRDYHKALTLWERITAAQPGDAEATSKLAIVHCRIGELLRDKGDLNRGVNHNRKAVTLMEGVIASGNNSPEARENLAWCYTSLADVVGNAILANLGDFTTAMGYYERALKLRDELLAENPSDPDRGKMTSIAHERIGMMLQARKDLPGAMEHFRRSLELDEPFLKEDPANIGKQRQLALDYQYLAAAAWDAEQVAEAKNYQIQNIQLAEKMVQNDPNDANIKITLATGYVRMLYMLGRSGDMAGANEYAQKAMRIAEALVARDPNNVGKLALIRGVDERMADLYLRAGDGAAALPYARDELELNARMFAIQPANTNVRRSQAATHAQLGKAYKLVASAAGANDAQEHWQNARAEFQQSLEIYEEVKAKGVLVGGEAAKPEQVANELASCQ